MTLQTLLFLIAVVVVIGALAYFSKKEGRSGSFHGKTEDDKDEWGAPAYPDKKPAAEPAQRIVVTDIQMPFESMVIFMIKWAIAAIPAAIILGVVFVIGAALLGGLATSIAHS